MKQNLTIENVIIEAKAFCIAQSKTPNKELPIIQRHLGFVKW
jgi:hypothetical protein